jgi:hypothetical protein
MPGVLVKHSARSLCFALSISSVLIAGCNGVGPSSLSPETNAARQPISGIAIDNSDWLDAQSKNVVQNGSFDTGKLAPWKSCGTATATVSKLHPFSGKYDALTGSPTTKQEVKGWSAICQTVKVPDSATLIAELYRTTNEKNETDAYQEVALATAAGKPTVVLTKSNEKKAGWVKESWDLSKYAGKSETLFFGVYGHGRKSFYDTQFVDDVTLIGASHTPPPTSSPTSSPTSAPTNASLQVTPSSLTFTSPSAQPVSASESGYTGAFNTSTSNASVATVSPSSANGPHATFSVTPVGAGTCTISVTDTNGQSQQVNVTVDNGVIHVSSVDASSTSGGSK